MLIDAIFISPLLTNLSVPDEMVRCQFRGVCHGGVEKRVDEVAVQKRQRRAIQTALEFKRFMTTEGLFIWPRPPSDSSEHPEPFSTIG